MRRIYILMIVVGVVLTPIASKIAMNQRGYAATGGEVLIIPLFLLIALLADQIREMILAINTMQEKEKSQ